MLYEKSSNEKKRSCLASQCDSKSRFFGYTLFIIILDIYFILLPHTYRLTDLSCSKEEKLNAENSRRRRWSFSQPKYFFSFYLLILFWLQIYQWWWSTFYFFTLVWWKCTRSRFFSEKRCFIVRESLAYFSNDREDDNIMIFLLLTNIFTFYYLNLGTEITKDIFCNKHIWPSIRKYHKSEITWAINFATWFLFKKFVDGVLNHCFSERNYWIIIVYSAKWNIYI